MPKLATIIVKNPYEPPGLTFRPGSLTVIGAKPSIDNTRDYGCIRLRAVVEKDWSDHIREYDLDFWGARFYPALPEEFERQE
jgi:hypothetical protein